MQKVPTYEAPSAGVHVATLTKIADLGVQPTNYGPKPLVRLRFEVAEKDSRGCCKFVTRTLTNSLHEKANFTRFFAEIGRPLPDGDSDLDTDSLLGTRFEITLSHVRVDGKVKVRIESVGPLAGTEKK
jgi:hypothetical protein